jgi:hypothetical protein
MQTLKKHISNFKQKGKYCILGEWEERRLHHHAEEGPGLEDPEGDGDEVLVEEGGGEEDDQHGGGLCHSRLQQRLVQVPHAPPNTPLPFKHQVNNFARLTTFHKACAVWHSLQKILLWYALLYVKFQTHAKTAVHPSTPSVSRFQEKEKRGEMITINDNTKYVQGKMIT